MEDNYGYNVKYTTKKHFKNLEEKLKFHRKKVIERIKKKEKKLR